MPKPGTSRSSACPPVAAAHDRAGAGGILVATRLPAYIFQKSAHGVELSAETRPVSRFQALHCLIVVVECLARPICRRACERRSRRSTRGRRRSASFEERRQCLGERLLHHHMFTI